MISYSEKMKQNNQSKLMIRSVQRALNILEALKNKIPEKSIKELSHELALSPSTIYRLLTTLKNRGYIEKNTETSKYRLGLKVFEVGSAVLKRMSLREEAKPVLMDLAKKTGDSAHLIVQYEDEALCLERINGDNYLKALFLVVGGRMPMHIGASPRVLLAYLPEPEIDKIITTKKLTPWTKKSITRSDILKQNLRQIKEQGYALSFEDATEGVAAIGAPVRNHTEKVIAAISVGGPCIHFKSPHLNELIELVKRAAKKLSKNLGYVDDKIIDAII